MPLSHLLLICHSTQEANVGDYAAYGLTEESYTRKVATEVVRLLGLVGPDVRAVLVNPIATDAGKAAQTVGDLMVKVNALHDAARSDAPGVVTRVLDIHTDAGGAYGTTGLYYTNAGKAWISAIYDEVRAVSPGVDHGVRRRTDLGILTGTKPVAGLIELAPHDREDSTAHLVEHPELYAAACVRGICASLSLPYPTEPVPVPVESLADVLARIAADVAKAQALA